MEYSPAPLPANEKVLAAAKDAAPPHRGHGSIRHCLARPSAFFVDAAPIGGAITGKVVMKTAGAALPTTPLTVTLLYFNPGLFRTTDEAADARTTTTAPDGSFTFTGLDASSAGVYRVLVQYKGVSYEPAEQDYHRSVWWDRQIARGALREQRDDGNDRGTDLRTRRQPHPAAFTITSDQIIMNEVRPQFYSVLEAYQITNPGDRHWSARSIRTARWRRAHRSPSPRPRARNP